MCTFFFNQPLSNIIYSVIIELKSAITFSKYILLSAFHLSIIFLMKRSNIKNVQINSKIFFCTSEFIQISLNIKPIIHFPFQGNTVYIYIFFFWRVNFPLFLPYIIYVHSSFGIVRCTHGGQWRHWGMFSLPLTMHVAARFPKTVFP